MRIRLQSRTPRVTVAETRRLVLPGKTADPFYSTPEWRALIKAIIAKRGRRCEQCSATHKNGKTIRVFGDHIVELRDGGAPLDEGNILLRCGSCHTRKTLAERGRRMAVRFDAS